MARKRRLGKVGKQVLLFLMETGEGFFEGIYRAIAYPHMNFSKYTYGNVYRCVNNLERKGLVTLVKKKRRIFVKLTDIGLESSQKIASMDLVIKKPNKWDGMWRLIIFDIPESQRLVRDVLRAKIVAAGFVQLQKSVFVIPWPCKTDIERIQKIYQARRFIKYLEVAYFDDEIAYRRKFGVI